VSSWWRETEFSLSEYPLPREGEKKGRRRERRGVLSEVVFDMAKKGGGGVKERSSGKKNRGQVKKKGGGEERVGGEKTAFSARIDKILGGLEKRERVVHYSGGIVVELAGGGKKRSVAVTKTKEERGNASQEVFFCATAWGLRKRLETKERLKIGWNLVCGKKRAGVRGRAQWPCARKEKGSELVKTTSRLFSQAESN